MSGETEAPASASVVSRVRKLLALARSKGSPQEAATAAAFAHELMSKHKLTEEDVAEVTSFVEEMELSGDGMMSVWRVGLLASVATFYDCVVVRKRAGRGAESVKIVGKARDAKATRKLYAFLAKEIEACCADDMADTAPRCGVAATRGMRDAYRRGAAITLRDRLAELRERAPATVRPGSDSDSGLSSEHKKVSTGLGRYRGPDDDVDRHMKDRYGGAPKAAPPPKKVKEEASMGDAANEAWAFMLGKAAAEGIPLPEAGGVRPARTPEAFADRPGSEGRTGR